MGRAFAKQFPRSVHCMSRGKPRNLPFHQRTFEPADSCRLACAIYVCDGSFLEFVDLHKSVLNPAASEPCEFHIRQQMKTAGKIVAFHLANTTLVRKLHCRNSLFPFRRNGPPACPERGAPE